MRYKKDWEATKQRFEDYWKGENTGRPLMRVTGVKRGKALSLLLRNP